MLELLKQGLTRHKDSVNRQYFGPQRISVLGLATFQYMYWVQIQEQLLKQPEKCLPSNPLRFQPDKPQVFEVVLEGTQVVGTLCQLSQMVWVLAAIMNKVRNRSAFICLFVNLYGSLFVADIYPVGSYFREQRCWDFTVKIRLKNFFQQKFFAKRSVPCIFQRRGLFSQIPRTSPPKKSQRSYYKN